MTFHEGQRLKLKGFGVGEVTEVSMRNVAFMVPSTRGMIPDFGPTTTEYKLLFKSGEDSFESWFTEEDLMRFTGRTE